MDNKQKVIFFAVLASIFAVMTTIFSANQSISHVLIVLPLVIMAIFLFFAGYYAGLSKRTK